MMKYISTAQFSNVLHDIYFLAVTKQLVVVMNPPFISVASQIIRRTFGLKRSFSVGCSIMRLLSYALQKSTITTGRVVEFLRILGSCFSSTFLLFSSMDRYICEASSNFSSGTDIYEGVC